MRFLNWVLMLLQKTIPFSSPSRSRGGRIRYAPTIGYVRFFEIPMRSPDRVRVILRNTGAISQPSTYEGSKNGSVFVLYGAACGAYSIRPYGCARTILRNTDAIPQPGTYSPSKKSPVFVSYGAVCGAY